MSKQGITSLDNHINRIYPKYMVDNQPTVWISVILPNDRPSNSVVYRWIDNNNEGRWYSNGSGFTTMVYFEFESDAVQYKLTWL